MSLVHIKNSENKILSPLAVEFNKQTQRIETLKRQIAEKTEEMDHCLSIWAESGIYDFKNILNLRFRFAQILNDFHLSNKLKSKSDRESLSDMIMMQVTMISHFEIIFVPEGFIEFREKLTKQKTIDLDEEALDYAANLFEEQIENLGIETDFDIREWLKQGANPKMFSEDLKNKMNEKSHEQSYENKNSRRNNSQRIKNKTDKKSGAEIINKNLSELYRQLARVFHPDLETDLDQKKIKEELMTELNLAYESKNFHSMLQMEIQWLSSSAERLEKLPEEKLKIYIDSLKEQVKILRKDLAQVPNERKYVVLQEISSPKSCYSLNSYRTILNDYAVESQELTATINLLLKPNGIKHLKNLIDEVNDYVDIFGIG